MKITKKYLEQLVIDSFNGFLKEEASEIGTQIPEDLKELVLNFYNNFDLPYSVARELAIKAYTLGYAKGCEDNQIAADGGSAS
jgi:hypothetical protein